MYVNVEIGRQKIIILFFGNNQAAQFYFWEYINWNQTSILDSHQPAFCIPAFSEAFLPADSRDDT
jgi:hypothetical protein